MKIMKSSNLTQSMSVWLTSVHLMQGFKKETTTKLLQNHHLI